MRKRKLMWILVSILGIIGIAVGGFTMHQHQEKQKMIRIATSKEAKKVYEKKIKKELLSYHTLLTPSFDFLQESSQ